LASSYQRCAFCAVQLQGIGQLPNGCGMGRTASTTLQVSDRTPAHASAFGQLFL
jgi:hypothetical protein